MATGQGRLGRLKKVGPCRPLDYTHYHLLLLLSPKLTFILPSRGHCSGGVQSVPTAAYRIGFHNKHTNYTQWDSILADIGHSDGHLCENQSS